MTQIENQLWQKIESFKLDDPDTKLTFSARLAKENRWTKEYTLRVIEEYRKFIFLCCVSPTQITPSDPVDQAWHLHLTYTRSYWTELCKNTLNRELHHNPTKGGESEKQKFDTCYTELKTIYKEKFLTTPPPDIWNDNLTRFNDIDFKRINLKQYWLVKKPNLKKKNILPIIGIIPPILLIEASGPEIFIIFIFITIILGFFFKNKGDGNSGSSGCSGYYDSGCSTDNGNGCSGDSGCSGCGGGCGGD